MTKWEYFTIGFKPPIYKIDCGLDEFGKDGWELVAFDFDSLTGIFKRPKLEEPEVKYPENGGGWAR